uniref:Uncharacterized protein n=1 Tax=Siphoviridae sp. ctvGX2 TaxID=2826512 RepID=A0A8S5LYR7_9CAUD|nr:MAG TPA: hypothetical protein [Siphoviridae sp. ctvGX2]
MTTYMIDTNADTDRLPLDGDHEAATAWFEANLPGDEIADFREALITAAIRLTGEDREFLACNGYKIVED